MPVVLGVDSSTQSCTVEVRDADDGRLLGTGRAPHPRTHPPVSEQDPAAWWQALGAATRAATSAAGVTGTDVVAMAVAAQCHGLVALGPGNAVLRPAKLWNDTTSAPQADRLVDQLGAHWWADRIGSVPTAAFTVTKLAWVAEHEPAVFAELRRVALPHDWLTLGLTGRLVTDRSEASGTGYWSPTQGWCLDILADHVGPGVDWATALPEVLGPAEPAGMLLPAAAEHLGLPPGILVGPGAGDQHAGALGLGLDLGDVALNLGTSGVVMTVHDRPTHDHTGWVTGVADAAGGFLPLVCTLNATKVTDTVAAWLGVDLDTLGDLALAAGLSPGAPVLAAFFDGERSPDRPTATGTLAGLRNDTSREDLALAAVSGVLAGLERGWQALRAAGAPAAGRLVVTGGGARSPAYRQVAADLFGVPVSIVDAPEATARGAAVQAAAVAAGADVQAVRHRWRPAAGAEIDPRPQAHSWRQGVRARYATVAAWDGLPLDDVTTMED